MASTDKFLTKYLSWEKSPLMSCEECLEMQDTETPPRDCPECCISLCFDCAEEHECDDDDLDDEDEWDDDEEEWGDDSEEDDDSDDEDDEE